MKNDTARFLTSIHKPAFAEMLILCRFLHDEPQKYALLAHVGDKKDILLAIGQNPVMADGKLEITPNEWLIPVAQSAKGIREALERVRTEPQQIQKASEEALSLNWCGRRESNSHRLLGRQTY